MIPALEQGIGGCAALLLVEGVEFAYSDDKSFTPASMLPLLCLGASSRRIMDELITLVRSIPEAGENVNPYADILQGDTSAPVHSLAMTFQEPACSRLGDFYEIHARSGLVVLLRGSLQVLLEGMPLSLVGGQAFFYLPFQTHFFLRESEDALLCVITFESTPGADTWSALRGRVFDMPLGWEKLHGDIIRFWRDRQGTASAKALHKQLMTIAGWSAENLRPQRTYPWESALMKLLKQPKNLQLRVKEIADIIQLSPNYLTEAFKSAYGVPLGSWLEHRRFGIALTMLAQKNIPIRTIAEETGFLSPTAFSRKMRIWCGMTPAQCREVLLSSQPHIRFNRYGQTIRPNV